MDSSESLLEALAAGDAFRRLDRLRATAPLFPRDARIWFHYARVAQEVGNDVEMRDALRCGLALDPGGWSAAGLELPTAEHQRIEALGHSLDVRDASDRLVHLRRIHERWPDDVPILFQYARALEAQGRHVEARMHHDRAQSLCPFLLYLSPSTRPGDDTTPAARFVGQIVGSYRVRRLASSFGDTSLYDATDVRDQEQPVTLWLIDGDGQIDDDVLEDMVAGFRHGLRHVVPIRDLARAPDGTRFLVLDRVHGRLFGDVMSAGRADPDFVVDIAWHAARSLRHLHDRAYLHGCLLPTNVIVLDDNVEDPVAFLDSGQDSRRRRKRDLPLLVRDATLRPHALAQRTPQAADLYGLGLLLYQGLTGTLPPIPATARAIDALHYGASTDKLRTVVRRCLGLDGQRGTRVQMIEEELRPLVMEFPVTVPAHSQLGRWVLDEILAPGSNSDVWRAHDHDTPARTAIVKVLGADKAKDREVRYRFELEALRTPRHPSIVAITSVDKVDRYTPYYVMEALPGPDLDGMIASGGPMPLPRTLTVALQVAEALAHAHELGVVHRDVNARNVVCADSQLLPRVKLIDFGVARIQSSTLTQQGVVFGKSSSIAPEQWHGSRDTAGLVDVYALGTLIYHCAAGQLIYGGNEADEPAVWMRRHVDEVAALDAVPAPLRPLLSEMLAKDPAHRPSMALVVERLRALGAETPGSSLGHTIAVQVGEQPRRTAWRRPNAPDDPPSLPPQPPPKPLEPPPRRRWPPAVPLGAVLAAAIASAGAGALWIGSQPSAPHCDASASWRQLGPAALHAHLQDLVGQRCSRTALAIIRERRRLLIEDTTLSEDARASQLGWLADLERKVPR